MFTSIVENNDIVRGRFCVCTNGLIYTTTDTFWYKGQKRNVHKIIYRYLSSNILGLIFVKWR